MKKAAFVFAFIAAVGSLAYFGLGRTDSQSAQNDKATTVSAQAPNPAELPPGRENLAVATLAGGCFWCVEADFEKVPGVVDVISGYTGGTEPMPTYQQVALGQTHHTEAVQIYYDPKVITFEGLLQVLWRTADPVDNGGQYYDRGKQYRPGIYYHNDEQRQIAEKARAELDKSGRYSKKVNIEIKPFISFWKAEDYHQDYYKKNPLHYAFYRYGSGRDRYQKSIWGNDLKIDFKKYRPKPAGDEPRDKQGEDAMPSMGNLESMPAANAMVVTVGNEQNRSSAKMDQKVMNKSEHQYVKPSIDELRKRLTPLQFNVTQHEGTEQAFDNKYWNEKRDGIYVDIVSGEPLFSSLDKYDSGTGWPSFTKPINPEFVKTSTDYKLFLPRTEVRSAHADSHLGHVFKDGPAPTGLRYCMNSAAMRFIPKDDLTKEGYGQYLALFEKK